MALAHNQHQFVSIPAGTMPVAAQQAPQPFTVVPAKPRKFCYLLANSIGFSAKSVQAIRLNKPDLDTTFAWMEKIICADQCEQLYVENLCMDDSRIQRIKSLCDHHGVTLTNLTVENASSANNLLVGPWH